MSRTLIGGEGAQAGAPLKSPGFTPGFVRNAAPQGYAAEAGPRESRTLCLVLAYSGCRLSEALALTAERVDLAAGTLVFESLKKRGNGLYRAEPVPRAVIDALDLAHDLCAVQQRPKARTAPLWPWSRVTAWRRVAGGHAPRRP